MNVEIDIEQADRLCCEVLMSWYEDALLDENVGSVLRAIDVLLQYGLNKEEYEEWSRLVHTSY